MKNKLVFFLFSVCMFAHAGLSDHKCDLCSADLGDRYWTSEDGSKVYCTKCYENSPRCHTCGVLLGNRGIKSGSELFCKKCYESRPHCKICDKVIVDRFFSVPGKDDVFCATCFHKYPHCELCGKPFKPPSSHHQSIPPKRNVCPDCEKDGIRDLKLIKSHFKNIQDWMEKRLYLSIRTPVGLKVERDDSPKIRTRIWSISTELGTFTRENNTFTIEIMNGLPEYLLVETLAHELAHAWQSENTPVNQRLVIKEGFAQWVAAKYLEEKGYSVNLQTLANRTDIYGEGYRLIRRIEDEQGQSGVLEYVRTVE